MNSFFVAAAATLIFAAVSPTTYAQPVFNAASTASADKSASVRLKKKTIKKKVIRKGLQKGLQKSKGGPVKFERGSEETTRERSMRLARECKGHVNAGACAGYTE
jgi:hypothetical protein